MMMNYDAPLYRPPSEIIFNFSSNIKVVHLMNAHFVICIESKEYSERPWEDVKAEIDMMSKYVPETKSFSCRWRCT